MVHTQRQHDPDGGINEVRLSAAQFEDLKDFLTQLHEKGAAARQDGVLSDTQFEKLISMLQPGFELSTRMLADYQRQHGDDTQPMPPQPGHYADLSDFPAALTPPAAAGRPVDIEVVAKDEQFDQQRERALAVDQGAFPDAPGLGDQRATAEPALEAVRKKKDTATDSPPVANVEKRADNPSDFDDF